jgi:hypothetical protein
MKGGSTEIALAGIDTDRYANAWIWSGSGWSTMKALNDAANLVTSASYEGCAVAWEYASGDLIALSSSGTNVRYYQYSGGSWSAVTNLAMGLGTGNVRYITLKSHNVASSNRMMLLTLDSNSDAYARSWDGSNWGANTALDPSMYSNTRRCIDGAWNVTGTLFLAVGGDSGITQISYKTWTPSGGWSQSSNNWSRFAGLTQQQHWIQVQSNPKGADPLFLIGTVDSDSDLVITTYTGTTMANQVEATTSGVATYESFDIDYSWPEPPA